MSFNVFPNPHRTATEVHRVLKKDGAVFGTVFVHPPPEEISSERAVEPDFVREILAVFDPALWEISFENEGGILFFHVQKSAR
jgi:hypothetical protein